MINSAKSFREFYEASFKNEEDELRATKLSQDFFADFIFYTPIKLELLESYLAVGHIDLFYKSLGDLKYLIEFSDNLNRYWHVLRGYSGALSKLKADQSVKSSKKIYGYYFEKYGDRRMIRNEHWLEKKRWEFLDELLAIYTETELQKFMLKYQAVLDENLEIYKSFLMLFIHDLKSLQPESVSVPKTST